MAMRRNFKCPICNKTYAMEWAKDNHYKSCLQKKQARERRNK